MITRATTPEPLTSAKTNTPSQKKMTDYYPSASSSLPNKRERTVAGGEEDKTERETRPLKNRGTGAGGANTTKHGNAFETKTDQFSRLVLQQGFQAIGSGHGFLPNALNKFHGQVIYKKVDGTNIYFVKQQHFRPFVKDKFGLDDCPRNPDEAFVFVPPTGTTGKIQVFILEKKEQQTEGSVETKLWSGPALKREYELFLGDRFEVHYAYCVNHFLKQKLVSSSKEKYRILFSDILPEAKVPVLFGDDPDYFEQLDKHVQSILDSLQTAKHST